MKVGDYLKNKSGYGPVYKVYSVTKMHMLVENVSQPNNVWGSAKTRIKHYMGEFFIVFPDEATALSAHEKFLKINQDHQRQVDDLETARKQAIAEVLK